MRSKINKIDVTYMNLESFNKVVRGKKLQGISNDTKLSVVDKRSFSILDISRTKDKKTYGLKIKKDAITKPRDRIAPKKSQVSPEKI